MKLTKQQIRQSKEIAQNFIRLYKGEIVYQDGRMVQVKNEKNGR